jgi:hypothetical protein
MVTLDLNEYDALTRLDFWIFIQRVFAELNPESFSDNFHIELLASQLDRIRLGTSQRIAVALPPRSLKSIIVSVASPAWLLGHDPSKEIICASYGQDLADKLAGDCRQVMQSVWYRRLFPHTKLAPGRQAIDHFKTTVGGCRVGTSIGGSVTGIGADVIIVDDPIKAIDIASDAERNRANSWARSTLFTRLNDKAIGAIIVVMQRLHEDDMIGHVQGIANFELLSFAAIAQEDEDYEIETPFGILHHQRREGEALHPERESLELLASPRRAMGSAFFAAQYLQTPTPPGGDIVKIDGFRRYNAAEPPKFDKAIQAWDTASKVSELSDYSVCTTWGVIGITTDERRVYLLHVARERLEYPDLKRRVRELGELFGAETILIEDSSSGVQLNQAFRVECFYKVQAVDVRGDKVMRMRARRLSSRLERYSCPRKPPGLKLTSTSWRCSRAVNMTTRLTQPPMPCDISLRPPASITGRCL